MPPANLELKDMLARLAQLPAEDSRAVLDGLDAAARQRIEALHRKIAHSNAIPAAASNGISDWVIERLGAKDYLAPATREAMEACIRALPAIAERAAGDRNSGLLARLLTARTRQGG